MNKGYPIKQNMDAFNLDILFKIKSTNEDEPFCLFDCVLNTYLNMKGKIPIAEVADEIITA